MRVKNREAMHALRVVASVLAGSGRARAKFFAQMRVGPQEDASATLSLLLWTRLLSFARQRIHPKDNWPTLPSAPLGGGAALSG